MSNLNLVKLMLGWVDNIGCLARSVTKRAGLNKVKISTKLINYLLIFIQSSIMINRAEGTTIIATI